MFGGRAENGDIISVYERGEEVGHGGMMGEVGQDLQKVGEGLAFSGREGEDTGLGGRVGEKT